MPATWGRLSAGGSNDDQGLGSCPSRKVADPLILTWLRQARNGRLTRDGASSILSGAFLAAPCGIPLETFHESSSR